VTPRRRVDRRSDSERFGERVERKAERKLRARRRAGGGIWYGLGMMGLVGWAVAVPVLLAVALGLWLDRMMGAGVSWTLGMVVLGFAVGCFNAWYWVRRESRADREEPKPEAPSAEAGGTNEEDER